MTAPEQPLDLNALEAKIREKGFCAVAESLALIARVRRAESNAIEWADEAVRRDSLTKDVEARVERLEGALREYLAQHAETAAWSGGDLCICRACKVARAALALERADG